MLIDGCWEREFFFLPSILQPKFERYQGYYIAFRVALPCTSSSCSFSLVTCLASITPQCPTILAKKTPASSLLRPHLQVRKLTLPHNSSNASLRGGAHHSYTNSPWHFYQILQPVQCSLQKNLALSMMRVWRGVRRASEARSKRSRAAGASERPSAMRATTVHFPLA